MPIKKQIDTLRIRRQKTPPSPRPAGAGSSFFHVMIAAGFAAAVAQIILLRELMVLCYGIELFMGVILATWLVGSALGCRTFAGASPRPPYPGALLILAALVLPLTLLSIRAAGHFLGVTPGEIPPLARLLPICLGATFPFSFLSGGLFGLCWNMTDNTAPLPISIYVGEALGSAAGGIFFYLLMIACQTALAIVLLTALGLLVIAARFFKTGQGGANRRKALLLIGFCTTLTAAGLIFKTNLDVASHRLQWGPDFVAAQDTPYQNLVMLKKDRQYSVFTNGLWLFSTPDPPSREWAVHPAMLMHPAPRSVLLLGGALAGLPEEILRHPSVRRLDAVELDPALASFSAGRLSGNAGIHDSKATFTLHYGDAAEFIRTTGRHYDVILMNVGDPVNAQMNRFYTASFFASVKKRLAAGGIFSFGVSGSEDMLGEVQIEFLAAIRRTLAKTFAHVSVLPGNPVRFFAGGESSRLTEDPKVLIDRIRERGLHLSYVREDTLMDRLEAFRLRYFNDVLGSTSATRINKDFSPLCYAYALRLWTSQLHSRLGDVVAVLTRLQSKTAWMILLLGCGLGFVFFRILRCRPQTAVNLSVASVGGLTIGVQMVLLIIFQIMRGALFLDLALIIALFMAGLAGGGAWVSKRRWSGDGNRRPAKLLIRIQSMICVFPLFLAGLFILLHGPLRPAMGEMISVVMFSGLSLVSGFLGGIHFAAASITLAELGHPVSGIGGRLYSFDLAGAAGSLLLATAVVIPALGPLQLLPMLAVVAATGLALLYVRL